MKDVKPCQRCGEAIDLIVERLPCSRSPLLDIATVGCLTCGNTECAPGLYGDHFADAAIARWNEQPAAWQETDVYWKPIDSFSVDPDAFAYKRPLYAKPTQK